MVAVAVAEVFLINNHLLMLFMTVCINFRGPATWRACAVEVLVLW